MRSRSLFQLLTLIGLAALVLTACGGSSKKKSSSSSSGNAGGTLTTVARAAKIVDFSATAAFCRKPVMNAMPTTPIKSRWATGPLLPDTAMPALIATNAPPATIRHPARTRREAATLNAKSMSNIMLAPKAPGFTNVENARKTAPEWADQVSLAYRP